MRGTRWEATVLDEGNTVLYAEHVHIDTCRESGGRVVGADLQCTAGLVHIGERRESEWETRLGRNADEKSKEQVHQR